METDVVRNGAEAEAEGSHVMNLPPYVVYIVLASNTTIMEPGSSFCS